MMYFFYDYIFYRLAQWFFKKDGKSGIRAIALISSSQSFMVGLIVLSNVDLFLTVEERNLHSQKVGYVGAVVFLLLYFVNYNRFSDKYDRLQSHWEKEPKRKKIIKAFWVLISLLLPVLLFAIVFTK
ncbi:MAG: hypothetical protein EOO87_07850 [Pedobacter sp.]|nr:MAG: hypothetical protein EOO87_07850 [Pedobacter sp.]